jgi:hypothetical protein
MPVVRRYEFPEECRDALDPIKNEPGVMLGAPYPRWDGRVVFLLEVSEATEYACAHLMFLKDAIRLAD